MFETKTRKLNCDMISELKIDGIKIERGNKIKFLGVIIDEILSWKPQLLHVSTVIARNTGVIYRTCPVIDFKTALLLYDTLIGPYLTYCNIVCASCAKSNLDRLLRQQKKAIRLVYAASRLSSSSVWFHRAKRLNLLDIYFLQLSSFMYLFRYNLLPSTFRYYFITNDSIHSYNTRKKNDLRIAFARTVTHYLSVKIVGPKCWNSLSVAVQNSSSLRTFKQSVKGLLLSQYMMA